MQKMKTKGKSKARKTFFMFSAATTVLSIFVCFHIYVGDMSKAVYNNEQQQMEVTKKTNEDSNSTMTEREKSLQRLTKRNYHAHEYCLQHNKSANSKTSGPFYLYEPKLVAYCEVPKIGCTFWKRLIRFLNKDFPPGKTNISVPSDLSRQFTHLGSFKTTPHFKFGSAKADKLRNMENSIMFSRDPYSRLWSAYLDKLFLPDFWHYVGIGIIRAERRKPDPMSLECGYDVTFPEFISFLVSHDLGIDWHFKPITSICNPCQTNFKFIGKQETFVQDVKFIINETGMMPDPRIDIFNETVVNEIKTLSMDYLNLAKLKPGCNNKTLICEKLWQVFQINGYIGFDIPFPLHLYKITDTGILVKDFIETVIKTHESGKPHHEIWKKQKRESLVSAYKVIPRAKLKLVQNIFKKDFEIFDYDKEPLDIFGTWTKEGK